MGENMGKIAYLIHWTSSNARDRKIGTHFHFFEIRMGEQEYLVAMV